MRHTIRRLKKAVTLIELVIAIALTTIVIGAATVILYSTEAMSKDETEKFSQSNQVKQLVLIVDQALSSPDNQTVTVNTDQISHPELLFTIENKSSQQSQYTFVQNELFRTDLSTSTSKKVTSIDFDVRIDIAEFSETPLVYKFDFKYGKDFNLSMSLIKELN